MGSDDHRDRRFEHHWEPSKHAVSFDSTQHPSGHGRGSVIVCHPTAPFIASLPDGAAWSESLLQEIAYAYLLELSATLERLGHPRNIGLPEGWLEALRPDDPGAFFGWLRIEPPFPADAEEGRANPRISSMRLLRKISPTIERDASSDGTGDDRRDTSVILVAAEKILDAKGRHPTNSDFGLRVVMHLAANDRHHRVSIPAMTASLPHEPYTLLLNLEAEEIEALQSAISDFLASREGDTKRAPDASEPVRFPSLDVLRTFFKHKDEEIAHSLQLMPGLSFEKLRFLRAREDAGKSPPVTLEVRGKGIGALSSESTRISYGFTARLGFTAIDTEAELEAEPHEKRPLITDAAPGMARVFEQDPASWRDLDDLHQAPEPYDWHARRTTRSEEKLDGFRRPVRIGAEEVISLATADFAVRNCPNFARNDPTDPRPKEVRLPANQWPKVRSDDHSALSAYWNCNKVFQTMRDFGLDPALYFTAVMDGLDVFYRSGIRPGPGKNGQTINARVKLRTDDAASDFLGTRAPKIEMHLALANLSHRARWVPHDLAPTWAEPLGIATSERWIWHEFGHVLIAARFAEPEFQFAHSAGDGLAAVWADPFSRLADGRHTPERMRGYTFPWVFLRRRHDRSVLNGWSWSGTFQRPVSEAPEDQRKGLKGYLSEQILSSTLFRLYRVLGGDTSDVVDGGPDYDTRQTASLVTLYLTMRGIEGMGLPPTRAEELEAAMIDADGGLLSPLTLNLHSKQSHGWKGGLAHKIIRWAFEAQGLHWPDDQPPHNAPGMPPPVDIYVADRRPREERVETSSVQHGPGSYVPVSLDWAGEPDWQMARAGQIGNLTIQIGNRGSEQATNVSLRAWWGFVDGDPGSRGWDRTADISWVPFTATLPTVPPIEAGGETEIELDETPPPGPSGSTPSKVLILLEATCPDDRANSDPAAGLPCAVPNLPASKPRQVADLVATDNNLGLLMVAPP